MRAAGILVAVLVVGVPHAGAKKMPSCPGGRYLVAGPTLTGLAGMAEPDAVRMDGSMVTVDSGCPAAKGRVRGTVNGTKVRVKWKSCPGLTGKAILKATLMEECQTIAGTFSAKKAGIAKPFLARMSRCGDGIWDPAGGESCDAGLGPCGGACNACACPGEATTTTTLFGASTSTTLFGATTSTTSPVPTTTTTTSPVPTTTSPVPTTTMFVLPTTSSSTTTVIATTTSTMPMLPTTSTTSTTLAGPDLRPHAWMSPGTPVPGGTNVYIEFTVRNFGNLTATASWFDYIMISGDQVFGSDQAIDVIERTTNLNASSQYTVMRPQVFIPDLPPGVYYLYLQTDGTNAVAENNESNNIGAFVPITIN